MNFKTWLEFADYGFDNNASSKPKGGTIDVDGQLLFKVVNSSKIMTELYRLPPIGPNKPRRKWNDLIEYGIGEGAFQISVTPLGSMKIITRRLVKNLIGEDTWLCKAVIPLNDNEDENKEIDIAHRIHNTLTEIANEMIPAPIKDYEGLEKLARDMWVEAKRNHPSYVMFPTALRKQNENYYKLVFEFRGMGVLRQKASKPSRVEQFNIDLVYENGLIRVMGYDIDSTLSQHSWKVQPSEFNEYFSPIQKNEEIVNNVIKIFMTY